jgi:hypothetical protein
MSLFRETFPDFITKELTRRQNGMLSRNSSFIHQLNTRAAWVRMTSGVNYNGSNNLAEQYVLQGGVLNNSKLKYGLQTGGSYDVASPGGTPHRMGIRPMPGITNINIQSKSAYGSLQEATVSFVAWDIKQLEELELLYMRPGYTVLLEFGWNYVNPMPKYDILNKKEISLNDAFAEIYNLIDRSGGNYDALLGYVKNYNWTARDDGGYDCTTTIISLGEVLESLKCNWVPIDTKAFSPQSILGYGSPDVFKSYQQGIIPGLLHELWNYMDLERGAKTEGNPNYVGELKDANNSAYLLYMSKAMSKQEKYDRGGYPKPLGTDNTTEGWITLGSFCELLNNYVLLKDGNNNPISQILSYETDPNGSIIREEDQFKNLLPKSLTCTASPLSLSTNIGVCWVRNDNWEQLEANSTTEDVDIDVNRAIVNNIPSDIKNTITKGNFDALSNRFTNKFQDVTPTRDLLFVNDTVRGFLKIADFTNLFQKSYLYSGSLENDLKKITEDLVNSITDVRVTNTTNKIDFFFYNNSDFISSIKSPNIVNFYDYFFTSSTKGDITEGAELIYKQLFPNNEFADNVKEIGDKNIQWSKSAVIDKIKKVFANASLSPELTRKLTNQVPVVAQNVANQAGKIPSLGSGLQPFLVSSASSGTKALGKIANIYVNMNFLYSQAISRNVASNDNQNNNNISIRAYLQGILREIQNSMGNINDFDIQVDNRNAIGRIIDINFTGETNKEPFTLQIHNTNSVVRNYNFQSKIFPEMGSIIAISAQDANGVGKLGYDNATLVAWNEGISDRLIPKKDFNKAIALSEPNNLNTFLFPFLTQLLEYFNAVQGKDKSNPNFAFGGLNFAYKDFLSHLAKYDNQNKYKTIIPTELSVKLDGIGGIVIGNLFKINEDIIPKGYRGVAGRKLAYIVTKINHTISDNDWVTELNAYPIIFETSEGVNVIKKFNKRQYPGQGVTIGVNGQTIINVPISNNAQSAYDKAEQAEPGFKNKVKSVAKAIGAQEMDLVKIMYIESARTLNPGVTNSIGCVGLIQFCPDEPRGNIKTIAGKKYLLSNLKQMTRIQQLNVVQEYFQSLGYTGQKTLSLTNMYLATFYPNAIGKPGNYIIGSEVGNSEYKFTIATQNPGIAQDSTAYVNGRKVIDVTAISRFISK